VGPRAIRPEGEGGRRRGKKKKRGKDDVVLRVGGDGWKALFVGGESGERIKKSLLGEAEGKKGGGDGRYTKTRGRKKKKT